MYLGVSISMLEPAGVSWSVPSILTLPHPDRIAYMECVECKPPARVPAPLPAYILAVYLPYLKETKQTSEPDSDMAGILELSD